MSPSRTCLALLVVLLISGSSLAAGVDARRLARADANNRDWLTHGRTYAEQRFSPLKRIHAGNVQNLGLAWYFDLDTTRGQEATPLAIDGTLYFTSAWSKVFAIDARSGREKWRYDPEVPGSKAIDACCDLVNRGLAAWGNRVFVGTIDGRLIALERASGKVAWSVQTTDPAQRYTITGAPRVIKGKVIIGNGGGEVGVRGYVSAYDAASGKLAWRFYTVPGNPADGFENKALERAAATWDGEWWRYGGGGTVWDSMAYDATLNLLYIGVGNGSPWNHRIRSNGKGDNLFLASIVALNADTGEYVWHFQTTPGETWDYTATQPIMLADLVVNGRPRQVLMQAPKNGFFYVLDRATGEFISGQNFVNVTWASGLDAQTGRPLEVRDARYLDAPALVSPGPFGGHNWYPMSFSPLTGLVYVPAQEMTSFYSHNDSFEFRNRSWNTGVSPRSTQPTNPQTVSAVAKSTGGAFLLAWNPVTQREAWRVSYPRIGNGGTLATAGNLVFQGSADGFMNAYAADTGARLWSYAAQNAVMAGPITYELDGEQYVVALAGIGGVAQGPGPDDIPRTEYGRVLAFKLDAKNALPALVPPAPRQVPDLAAADATGDPALGERHYDDFCAVCHGARARSLTSMPDLRYAMAIVDRAAFKSIVLDGERTAKGMVGFAAALTPADAEAIRAYLVSQARPLLPAARP